MNKNYLIGAFAFLVATFLIWNVSASCIMPGSVEEEFARADAVFEGTVMNVEEFDEMNNLVTFDVEIPVWKGEKFLPAEYFIPRAENIRPEDIFTISVIVPKADRVSVGYDYEINERYIVYAYDSDSDGQLETNSCTRANLNIEEFEKEKAELEVIHFIDVGGAIRGEVKIVEEIPAENDDYNLAAAGIKGDYLEVIVNYGGGCEEHEFTLFAEEGIMKSLPPQQNVYLVHENNGDMCEAGVNEKIIFDLKPLKKQFEVCPACVDCGEPCTYSTNELVLNVYDSEGKNKELTYILIEKDDDKEDEVIEEVEEKDGWFRRIFGGYGSYGCAKDAKICEDGGSVGRNPQLNCEFDPCLGEEIVEEESTTQKLVNWIKEIFN